MGSLDDADTAPELGYSDTGESVAVIPGHVYAVMTGDGLYGKIIVTDIGDAGDDYEITFNAALQLQSGNRNYKSANMHYQLGIH